MNGKCNSRMLKHSTRSTIHQRQQQATTPKRAGRGLPCSKVTCNALSVICCCLPILAQHFVRQIMKICFIVDICMRQLRPHGQKNEHTHTQHTWKTCLQYQHNLLAVPQVPQDFVIVRMRARALQHCLLFYFFFFCNSSCCFFFFLLLCSLALNNA